MSPRQSNISGLYFHAILDNCAPFSMIVSHKVRLVRANSIVCIISIQFSTFFTANSIPTIRSFKGSLKIKKKTISVDCKRLTSLLPVTQVLLNYNSRIVINLYKNHRSLFCNHILHSPFNIFASNDIYLFFVLTFARKIYEISQSSYELFEICSIILTLMNCFVQDVFLFN